MISNYMIQLINSSFAGHLGDEAVMAGAGMANMWLNIFCLSLTVGLNATLNTLVSQAYGFGDFRMCGVYLNRARIVFTLMFIPITILLLNTERIFVSLGFDPVAS